MDYSSQFATISIILVFALGVIVGRLSARVQHNHTHTHIHHEGGDPFLGMLGITLGVHPGPQTPESETPPAPPRTPTQGG